MKKIVIDYAKCDGIGICESIVPHVFEIQADASLMLLQEVVEDSRTMRLIEDAVASCPKAAISLVDAN